MVDQLIQVEDLTVKAGAGPAQRVVLTGVTLDVRRGEVLGIVGESGSGKSTLLQAMLGYFRRGLHATAGRILYDRQDLLGLSAPALRRLRASRLAVVPQSASLSLTPNRRVGQLLEEVIALRPGARARHGPHRALELLRQVSLPDAALMLRRYPHQLSGGQQQRLSIALALAVEPDVLFLDEPTTGLDATTQAHLLSLLAELGRSAGLTLVLVSHDIGVIARLSRRIAVLYGGELVEEGPAGRLLSAPAHPYTRALLASVPRLDSAAIPPALAESMSRSGQTPQGCGFAPRCRQAQAICHTVRPAWTDLPEGAGQVRCHFAAHGAADSASAAVRHSRLPHPTAVPLLRVDALTVTYGPAGGLSRWFGLSSSPAPAVQGISLDLSAGETVGLVGESGSGKSTLLKAIAGLLELGAGSIALAGTEPADRRMGMPIRLAARVEHRSLEARRRIQLVFQNPDASLNPRQTVAEILAAPLRLYFSLSGARARARGADLLRQVRLPLRYLDRLPAQLSGGEKQRVALARALAAEPDVLLCDEVTSALDVSVQAAVLELLAEVRRQRRLALLFVSHDLAVVRAIADKVLVLYRGQICETGTAEFIYRPPFHPYTRALLDAAHNLSRPNVPDRLPAMSQTQMTSHGCAFQSACPQQLAGLCDTTPPPQRGDPLRHALWCHRPLAELMTVDHQPGDEETGRIREVSTA